MAQPGTSGTEPRIVSFEAQLQPSSKLRVERPGADGRVELSKAMGGLLMLQIHAMPLEEKRRIVSDQAADPMLVLLAMLSPEERRQLVAAAETYLKELVTNHEPVKAAAVFPEGYDGPVRRLFRKEGDD